MKYIIVTALIVTVTCCCEALKCIPCAEETKAERCKSIDLSVCSYGTAKDVCQCCDVCAKGPGENCGGLWNMAGSCGTNLYCQPNNEDSDNPGKCSRQRPPARPKIKIPKRRKLKF